MPMLRSRGPLRLRQLMPVARWKCLQRSTGTSAMREEPDIRSQESDGTGFALSGNGPKQRGRSRGFTLAELLVSVGVLVLLVLLFTQLLNSAATITTLGHKQMDADSQARQLLDQMAFYSTVPGYYPSGYSAGSQSPVSLVAYRINAQNKLERMGKALVWNAVSTTDTPVVFIPIPVASPLPVGDLPSPTPNPTPTPAWPSAMNLAASPTPEPSAEVIGPQVVRFEYYYLLKNGSFSDIPWDTTAVPAHNAVSGMQDVAAIVVDIAVIDSKSKVLLTDAQVTTLAAGLSDYTAGMVPGQLRANWQTYLDGITTLPRPAISGVRLYERYLYLSPPTLGNL